jgi:hypothetical protein
MTAAPLRRIAAIAAALTVLGLVGCASTPASSTEAGATLDATPTPPQTTAAGPEPASTTSAMIEATQTSVRESAIWMARGVDSWFGDQPFTEDGAVRDGRLGLNLRYRQDEGFSVDLRFNARFTLPNLETLGYVFVGRDNPREIIADVPGAFTGADRLTPAPDENLSFFAGFGRALNEAVDLRLGFRGGLKPYAQARYRKPWAFGPDDRLEFRQTVFWSADDRLGATAAVSAEHDLSPILVARWLTAATVTQEEPDLGWQSRLSLHRAFGPERWLSGELLLSGRRNMGVDVKDVGVQLRWEQPLHQDKLLGEFIVGHFWPRPEASEPRGRAWAAGLSLKLKF